MWWRWLKKVIEWNHQKAVLKRSFLLWAIVGNWSPIHVPTSVIYYPSWRSWEVKQYDLNIENMILITVLPQRSSYLRSRCYRWFTSSRCKQHCLPKLCLWFIIIVITTSFLIFLQLNTGGGHPVARACIPRFFRQIISFYVSLIILMLINIQVPHLHGILFKKTFLACTKLVFIAQEICQ